MFGIADDDIAGDRADPRIGEGFDNPLECLPIEGAITVDNDNDIASRAAQGQVDCR